MPVRPPEASSGRFGLVEFLVHSAPTLSEAVRVLIEYQLLLGLPVQLRRGESIRGTTLQIHSPELPVDKVLATLREHTRVLTGVDVQMEVAVAGESASVLISAADLARPSSSSNPQLHALLLELAQQRMLQHSRSEIVARVVDCIARSLERRPTIVSVSRELGYGKRTLQRRLAKEGKSFSDLLNEARQRVLREELMNEELTVKELSARLGYSDARSFSRAFKEWTGTSPRSYRRQAGAPELPTPGHRVTEH